VRILFIGRFQPFHSGHLEAMRYLSRMGDVLIAVGSAQYAGTFRNPFAYAERELMIKAALDEAGMPFLDIVPVKDIHNHQRWAEHVQASIPAYESIFTNSEIDRRIFEFAGERVMKEWYFERERYEGKKVREALAAGKGWRELVPPAVAKYLEEINAEERLRVLKEKGPSGESE
jgi:nicotinamide-nucleotide adenylyltransferase